MPAFGQYRSDSLTAFLLGSADEAAGLTCLCALHLLTKAAL